MNDTGRGTADARQSCYCETLVNGVTDFLRSVGPRENVREHFRAARIEVLKGLRQMIDNRIERMQQKDARGTTIVVE